MKCVKVHLCDPERPDGGVHPGVQRAGQQDGEGRRDQADELLHRQHDAQLRQGEIIQWSDVFIKFRFRLTGTKS